MRGEGGWDGYSPSAASSHELASHSSTLATRRFSNNEQTQARRRGGLRPVIAHKAASRSLARSGSWLTLSSGGGQAPYCGGTWKRKPARQTLARPGVGDDGSSRSLAPNLQALARLTTPQRETDPSSLSPTAKTTSQLRRRALLRTLQEQPLRGLLGGRWARGIHDVGEPFGREVVT